MGAHIHSLMKDVDDLDYPVPRSAGRTRRAKLAIAWPHIVDWASRSTFIGKGVAGIPDRQNAVALGLSDTPILNGVIPDAVEIGSGLGR